jgi:linoleoyl-CoA desaturase
MPDHPGDAPPDETPDGGFFAELRRRVHRQLVDAGLPSRDLPAMYAKTAVIFFWLVTSYSLLVFWPHTAWQVAALSVSLGLAVAGIGFNVQHDGSHGSYSNNRRVNRLMALTLDLLGGSSYVWKRKHNVLHHTWPNVTGVDDDIDVGPLGRLSPHQPRLAIHRLQHLYLWPLYGFLAIKWQLFDDFRALATGCLGSQPLPRPGGKELVTLVGGKLLFAGWAFGLPLLLHPAGTVLAVYVACAAVAGLTLSVVFQLAHCVSEAAASTGEEPWAVRQAQASVDFAQHSRILGWYLGGLNFQIEHHLFPKVCHLHYGRLAPVVAATCREYGVSYHSHPTLGAALLAHFRHLRDLGSGSEGRPRGLSDRGRGVGVA